MTTQYMTTEENNLKGRVQALEQMLVRVACYLRVHGQIQKNSMAEMAIDSMIRCCIAEHMSDAEFVDTVRRACSTSEPRVRQIATQIEKGE